MSTVCPQVLTFTAGAATVEAMRSEKRLNGLFEDLEQQAEGLRLSDRDAEIADRVRAEYAAVDFAARLHASVSASVRLTVTGLGAVEGMLTRTGVGWCLLEDVGSGREWILRTAAVTRAQGLSDAAVGAPARSALTRLGLGSALRGLSDSRAPVVLVHVDGSRTQGQLGRVGADFVEVRGGYDGHDRGHTAGRVDLVPFDSLAAVHPV